MELQISEQKVPKFCVTTWHFPKSPLQASGIPSVCGAVGTMLRCVMGLSSRSVSVCYRMLLNANAVASNTFISINGMNI